jgi:hypothetical protein
MTKDDLERHSHVISGLKKTVDDMAYEMKDERNDGWVKEHYKTSLKAVRDHINKVLEQ